MRIRSSFACSSFLMDQRFREECHLHTSALLSVDLSFAEHALDIFCCKDAPEERSAVASSLRRDGESTDRHVFHTNFQCVFEYLCMF